MKGYSQPVAVFPPMRFRNRWATVAIDELKDSKLALHVSIMMGRTESLYGRDIDVRVLAAPNGRPLKPLTQPEPDHPLLTVRLRGQTGIADFVFANPRNRKPRAIVVAIQGDTRTFEMSELALRERAPRR